MSKIATITAYEIIDSRGIPTLEGRLVLDNGKTVIASVPAGTSLGKYECVEKRDNDMKRLNGLGVTEAVMYVNTLLGPKLKSISPLKQKEIDYWMIHADGTNNKSKLGANTILLVSLLVAKAGAADQNMSLWNYINSLYASITSSKIAIERVPPPLFNIINGGKHGNNNLEFQEFQIVPSSSLTFTKAYEMGMCFFHMLKKVLAYRNAGVSVGEEGGFSPNLSTNTDAIEVLVETSQKLNLQMGVDVFLGLDIAASHFYHDDRYFLKDKPHPLKSEEYIEFLKSMIKNYSILTLEDPLSQDEWQSWTKLYSELSKEVYLIGDDLLTTNKAKLTKAISEKACNAIIIKPNQIGTLTETFEVIDLARKNDISYIVSHRSGETNDTFIADYAVGVQSDFVKFGATSRGERVAKYNRLWQIEREELR